MHKALFKHGELPVLHSSTLISQFVPVQNASHKHEYTPGLVCEHNPSLRHGFELQISIKISQLVPL